MEDDAVASWISRLGLPSDLPSQNAVREALTVAPDPPDEDSLRLLVAAATNAAGGAQRVAERVATAGRPLAKLAAGVAPYAATTPHPWHVLTAVARRVADPQLSLMSDDTYGGMARMQAAQCRGEIAAQEAHRRFDAERAGRPLLETETWRSLAENSAPHGTWQRVWQSLQEPDVEHLVEAALAEPPRRDVALVLGMLRGLHEAGDGRLTPEAAARLAQGLRRQASDPTAYHAIEAWSALDPPAFFAEILARYERTGSLDQRLLGPVPSVAKKLPAEGRAAAASTFAAVVRDQLGRGVAPFQSLDWWLAFDRAGAARFLAEEVVPESLDARTTLAVLRPLRTLATPAAVEILRRIHGSGREGSEDALVVLEVLGAAPPDRIEALAARWRETRDGRLLRQLHDRYIDHCGGAAFGVWRQRLGEESGERSFWVRAADGTGLFIETDEQDRLTGWSMR